jgi:hypothetical protein
VAVARAEVTIGQPAGVIWARIRDFGDITWIPNTKSCRIEGDVRYIRMHGVEMDVIERLLAHDDVLRSCSYLLVNPEDLSRLIGAEHSVAGLEATLSVNDRGESAAEVTWDIDTAEIVIGSVQAEYQAALENLKTLLEGSPEGNVRP